MSSGRHLYERYRRHEPGAVHWNWLPQETREFWDHLEAFVEYERRSWVASLGPSS